MPVRSDLDYVWPVSPRIVEVRDDGADPTNLSVEDIVDSFREKEVSFEAIDDDDLLEATGRDDLGGGVEVGITATGLNTQIAFKARTTPISTATVTTGDVNGKNLLASASTFQTDLVKRGDIVINFTDFSMGSVLSVTGESDLTIDGLTGGTDNQFDIGDVCKIYPVVQCEISGGNWVAVDDLGATISPVFPTAFTQIVRTSASSATTANQEALEFATFQNRVTIDVVNGVAGTTGLIGTSKEPVNNVLDAVVIANAKGLKRLFIVEDIVFDAGYDITGFAIEGESPLKSLITVDAAAIVNGAEFEECTLQGTLDANSTVKNSTILDLGFFEGRFHHCSLEGTIILGGTGTTHIVDCHDGTEGGGPVSLATIDMGGSGRGLIVRNFAGGLALINKTGPEEISIGISRGRCVLDSTVSNGEILVRIGTGKITNNATGTAVVTGEVLSPQTIANAVWDEFTVDHTIAGSMSERMALIEKILRNRMETNPSTGIITLYNDDDSVLLTASVYEDVAATTPYAGNKIDRKDRLT